MEVSTWGKWSYPLTIVTLRTFLPKIGFLVNKKIADRVQEFKGVNDRIATMTMRINERYQIQITQVYAPTTDHDDEEVEELYEELSNAMEQNQGRRG